MEIHSWSILTIVGPILLIAVLAWALFRNKRDKTPRDEAKTERATHDLYEQIDREDAAEDDRVQR